MRAILLPALVVLLLVEAADAHGGAYRGPWQYMPRDSRDVPPAPPPSAATPVSPSSGNPRSVRRSDECRLWNCRHCLRTHWAAWWAFNREGLLGLPSVGPTNAAARALEAENLDAMVREAVLPALERVLDRPDSYFDARAAAVIALGRLGADRADLGPRIAQRLIPLLRNVKGSEHFSVEESAALALGLLGYDDARGSVRAALHDVGVDPKGRVRSQRTRAFALLGLGLFRGDEDREPGRRDLRSEAFRTILRDSQEYLVDVPVCALTGMGLTGDPGYVEELVEIVAHGYTIKFEGDREVIRSHAVSALGRIVAANRPAATCRTADVLTDALLDGGPHTAVSAAIAMGQLGRHRNLDADLVAHAIHALESALQRGDVRLASFALIALGEIGGATGSTRQRDRAFESLRTAMRNGVCAIRPFGALALGILGDRSDDDLVRAAIAGVVRPEFARYRGDPRHLGAYVLSLGLLGDARSAPAMTRLLEDRGEIRAVRGKCAEALAILAVDGSPGVIRRTLLEPEDRDLRIDLALAAGRIGDRDAVPCLIRVLRDRRAGLFVQGSVARALAFLRDIRTVDVLIRMAEDPEQQKLNRALAVTALGLIAGGGGSGNLGRIARDANYHAPVHALDELFSIL